MKLLDATRSELAKQLSTSTWWILALVLLLYVGSTAAGLGGVFAASAGGSLPGEAAAPAVPGADIPPLIYSLATAIGYVFPLLIGVLMVTGEFRHQTLTPTFLATPRRGIALGGKLVAGAVVGVGYGLVALLSTMGPGAGILALLDVDPALTEADTWAMAARILVAFVLWVLIGIGVGVLVRNQVVAIVLVLAFTQFVEPIVRTVGAFVDGFSEVTPFLPGGASDGLVGASLYSSMTLTGATDAFVPEWWLSGLVLLGYAVVLLVAGFATSWRRDVA